MAPHTPNKKYCDLLKPCICQCYISNPYISQIYLSVLSIPHPWEWKLFFFLILFQKILYRFYHQVSMRPLHFRRLHPCQSLPPRLVESLVHHEQSANWLPCSPSHLCFSFALFPFVFSAPTSPFFMISASNGGRKRAGSPLFRVISKCTIWCILFCLFPFVVHTLWLYCLSKPLPPRDK